MWLFDRGARPFDQTMGAEATPIARPRRESRGLRATSTRFAAKGAWRSISYLRYHIIETRGIGELGGEGLTVGGFVFKPCGMNPAAPRIASTKPRVSTRGSGCNYQPTNTEPVTLGVVGTDLQVCPSRLQLGRDTLISQSAFGCSSASLEPEPGSGISHTQQPGWPKLPQQLCRVRIFVQLLARVIRSLLKKGRADSRQLMRAL